jgi:hypothetical protein
MISHIFFRRRCDKFLQNIQYQGGQKTSRPKECLARLFFFKSSCIRNEQFAHTLPETFEYRPHP